MIETVDSTDSVDTPRLGPPLNDWSLADETYAVAESVGLTLRPWQAYALDVAMSIDAAYRFKYREVAIICARQNGKSKILIPRIVWALQNGRTVMHTAQNAKLPRRVFLEVAGLFPDAKVRLANGQEEITTKQGGRYIIVAPQRSARGETADDLIIDELREMEDFDFIAAAEPTLTESANPQVIALSNAGTEKSAVLNDLKLRGKDGDERLAYMEWSAHPDRNVQDRQGWLEANPSIGYGNNSLDRLAHLFERYEKAGELAVFETEHLCRWVKSMLPRLVSDVAWQSARNALEGPKNPVMAVSVHPSGRRASAVISWPQSDGSVGLAVIADVKGDPIDLNRLAADLIPQAQKLGVTQVGFDSWTDQHLARHFLDPVAIVGPTFANASERFVRAIETGQLHWEQADAISEQLPYVSRKSTTGTAWAAEGTDKGRPVTAVYAAIRAVWLASNPQVLTPAIY